MGEMGMDLSALEKRIRAVELKSTPLRLNTFFIILTAASTLHAHGLDRWKGPRLQNAKGSKQDQKLSAGTNIGHLIAKTCGRPMPAHRELHR
jgi:hypothetical protein